MSIFSKISKTKVGSNVFDLTHDNKLSTQMGLLTPFLTLDCVPGDKISLKSSVFLRFAPLIAPVMHRVSVYCHFFFVPHRLVWDGFEDFITGGEDGFDSTVWPYVKHNPFDYDYSSLADYLGLPVRDDVILDDVSVSYPIIDVSAMPYATYAMIFNEYYRDQNLVGRVPDTLTDGDNSAVIPGYSGLLRRAWQHDYFTSSLPWTQKGPEAMLPAGGLAPVVALSHDDIEQGQIVRDYLTGLPVQSEDLSAGGGGEFGTGVPQTGEAYLDITGSHYADLSQATATSINELRQAFRLQEWLEKNARGGSRYIESVSVHFGVESSDKRLQRPEYLGGSSTPVKISEVLQMSASEETSTPQGNMAGHGVSIGSGDRINYYCEEHGYIMGIMSVLPMSSYQQGVPKHFLRSDKFDYFWPEFAHLGEQSITNKELFLTRSLDPTVQADEVFGYIPRYAEYKYINNGVHGDFKDSLDFWHLGRKFATSPALNTDFIRMDPNEVSRIFAVTESSSDNLWIHVLNDIKARRKMPFFGTPKF